MHMRRICFYLVSALILSPFCLGQQDWIRTGTGLGVEKIRLAVPDFKAAGTETQTAELLGAIRDSRIAIPVMLGVLCGLRRGEIAALRWKNVDLRAKQMSILQSA